VLERARPDEREQPPPSQFLSESLWVDAADEVADTRLE
jgi:hypothetical protein